MNDLFSNVFGAAGIEAIQIGSKKIAVAKPATKTVLRGYGDTIKVGDVAYYTCLGSDGKKWTDGPFRLDAISATDNPWFRFTQPDGGVPIADYTGSGWSRTFKLADKETTNKLNAALKYHGLYRIDLLPLQRPVGVR
jgi:hypothetical protein